MASGKRKERSKREIVTPEMASLTVQPIAEVQLADDVLKQFDSTQLVEATVIKAKELEIVWGNDKRYWEYKMEDRMEVAKLKEVCWLDVKGKMAMNPDKFSFGAMYSASFLIKRAPNARNLNNIKLSLGFNDGKPPKEKVVDLSKIAPADKWVTVTISDFKFEFCGLGREMTVSLTNHDDCCKTGLTIAGVTVLRIQPFGQN